jgi:hypothetical protein
MKLGLKLRGEHRLDVFENKVLRRILGPNQEEIIRKWKQLRNELRNSSPHIIREI